MSLTNEVTTSLVNTLENHVGLVNGTTQAVTQSYVDTMKNVTTSNSTITQNVSLQNVTIRGGSTVNITQEGNIEAELLAQNRISNTLNDRTSLASLMQTALEQAVDAQAELDTAQKAVNTMEQLDQNNGGPDGVAAKMADTATNIFGGGNSDMDTTNILNSSVEQNTNNSLNMTNLIGTSLNKNLRSDNFTECAMDLRIDQVAEIKNSVIEDDSTLNIMQKASLQSLTNCFNEVYNIKDIATEISTTTGMTAKQALTNLAKAKTKQDLENTLKQTKLQKNFLDSLMGNFGFIIIAVIAIIVLGGGALKGDEEGKGNEGGSGKGGNVFSRAAPYVALLCIVALIAGSCYLAYKHRDAFKSVDGVDLSSIDNKNAIFYLKKDYDKFKIFHGENDEKRQLLVKDSNTHSSGGDTESRPTNSKNLVLSKDFDENDKTSNFIFEEVENNQSQKPSNNTCNIDFKEENQDTDNCPVHNTKSDPKIYKIFVFVGSTKYQLGFLYSNKTRKETNTTVVEPILYEESTLSEDHKKHFVFTIFPDYDENDKNNVEQKYTINHVNKLLDANDDNSYLNPLTSNLKENSFSTLMISDKPLYNNGKFENDDIRGAEFHFTK